MLVLIFTLIIVVTLVFLFTPNPLIKKIHHGEPLKLNKKKIKRVMLGMNFTDGLVYKITLYALLIIVSFIFLYPVIYMLLTAVKPQMDLADSAAGLLPSSLDFSNYKNALEKLSYFKSLYKSMLVALIPTVLNVVVASITAYGFATFRVPLKKLWFAVMLATYIVPKALISIPQYAWYSQLKLLGSIFTYILPATFGQGLYFALYFLILYSTFKQIPKQLEESAKIDGASNLQIFFKIVLPLILPSLITVTLVSFVWYWNDAETASMYLNIVKAGQTTPRWVTLPIALQNFQLTLVGSEREAMLYRGVEMAATFLSIAPLLLIYLFLQRYFVEGIEKSGITGE